MQILTRQLFQSLKSSTSWHFLSLWLDRNKDENSKNLTGLSCRVLTTVMDQGNRMLPFGHLQNIFLHPWFSPLHVSVQIQALRKKIFNLKKIYYVFFSIFKLFYCCSIIVVSIFSPPLYPTPAKPTSLPCFHPLPWFCPCVLYSSSWKPFSTLSHPPSPLAMVRLFLTSVSLVIFCLLFSSVDYALVKDEIIWYLSLTAWLISLSIMLSSSIHAVCKGYKLLLSLCCVEFHCVSVK